MGFGKTGKFNIVNKTGTDLEHVRISHFMKGDEYIPDAELVVIPEFSKVADPKGPYTFKSISGKNDHWSVAFKNSDGCWMSKDLDASMSSDYEESEYMLIIDKTDFTFFAKKKKGGTKSKPADVTSIYNATKA